MIFGFVSVFADVESKEDFLFDISDIDNTFLYILLKPLDVETKYPNILPSVYVLLSV